MTTILTASEKARAPSFAFRLPSCVGCWDLIRPAASWAVLCTSLSSPLSRDQTFPGTPWDSAQLPAALLAFCGAPDRNTASKPLSDVLWAHVVLGPTPPGKSQAPSCVFLVAGWLLEGHPCKPAFILGSTRRTRSPLSLLVVKPPAQPYKLQVSPWGSGSQRKCFVAAKGLTQLDWGLWVCFCLFFQVVYWKGDLGGGWRLGERGGYRKIYHTAGSGATSASGGRRQLRLCIQHALKFFLTFPFPTNNRGISDTAVANWQEHAEIKGFPAAPWLSSGWCSAGQADAVRCELRDPREPAESGPKKCLSHPCICEVYKEQSYFSLIANYSSWQASFPPTFIHSEKIIKSPFNATLQWGWGYITSFSSKFPY